MFFNHSSLLLYIHVLYLRSQGDLLYPTVEYVKCNIVCIISNSAISYPEIFSSGISMKLSNS